MNFVSTATRLSFPKGELPYSSTPIQQIKDMETELKREFKADSTEAIAMEIDQQTRSTAIGSDSSSSSSSSSSYTELKSDGVEQEAKAKESQHKHVVTTRITQWLMTAILNSRTAMLRTLEAKAAQIPVLVTHSDFLKRAHELNIPTDRPVQAIVDFIVRGNFTDDILRQFVSEYQEYLHFMWKCVADELAGIGKGCDYYTDYTKTLHIQHLRSPKNSVWTMACKKPSDEALILGRFPVLIPDAAKYAGVISVHNTQQSSSSTQSSSSQSNTRPRYESYNGNTDNRGQTILATYRTVGGETMTSRLQQSALAGNSNSNIDSMDTRGSTQQSYIGVKRRHGEMMSEQSTSEVDKMIQTTREAAKNKCHAAHIKAGYELTSQWLQTRWAPAKDACVKTIRAGCTALGGLGSAFQLPSVKFTDALNVMLKTHQQQWLDTLRDPEFTRGRAWFFIVDYRRVMQEERSNIKMDYSTMVLSDDQKELAIASVMERIFRTNISVVDDCKAVLESKTLRVEHMTRVEIMFRQLGLHRQMSPQTPNHKYQSAWRDRPRQDLVHALVPVLMMASAGWRDHIATLQTKHVQPLTAKGCKSTVPEWRVNAYNNAVQLDFMDYMSIGLSMVESELIRTRPSGVTDDMDRVSTEKLEDIKTMSTLFHEQASQTPEFRPKHVAELLQHESAICEGVNNSLDRHRQNAVIELECFEEMLFMAGTELESKRKCLHDEFLRRDFVAFSALRQNDWPQWEVCASDSAKYYDMLCRITRDMAKFSNELLLGSNADGQQSHLSEQLMQVKSHIETDYKEFKERERVRPFKLKELSDNIFGYAQLLFALAFCIPP